MIITLGGKTGAGKGTLAKRLADHLGYDNIGIGDIKRELAKEMGLTIFEFDQIGWNDPQKAQEFDLKFEDYQKSLGLDEKIVLDGRMAFWCQPQGFNVFLDVSDEVGAQRVFDAQRDSDARSSFDEVLRVNTERNERGRQTYLKLYEVDIYDLSQYDIVIDTTDLNPDEIFDRVIQGFEEYSAGK